MDDYLICNFNHTIIMDSGSLFTILLDDVTLLVYARAIFLSHGEHYVN